MEKKMEALEGKQKRKESQKGETSEYFKVLKEEHKKRYGIELIPNALIYSNLKTLLSRVGKDHLPSILKLFYSKDEYCHSAHDIRLCTGGYSKLLTEHLSRRPTIIPPEETIKKEKEEKKKEEASSISIEACRKTFAKLSKDIQKSIVSEASEYLLKMGLTGNETMKRAKIMEIMRRNYYV